MTAAHRSPQIARIARLLDVEAIDVIGLDGICDDDLRAFHDQIGLTLFADGQHRFARVANLSKMLPGAVAGKLAERFLPPTLAARVAELLEPAKARELVTKVSVAYLADLALVLDPTRSKPVVQAIPADRVAEVARELFDRKEYGAMAEFAGTVTLDALFGALGVATARDLLEVVPLLVWNDNIDKVVADIPPAKIDAILSEIVADELWEQASYLIERLHPAAIGTVAKGLFERGEYSAMARFAGIVDLDALFAAIDVATARDLLEIVPLIEWGPNIERVVAEIPAERIEALLREISDTDLWAHGSYVIERLPATTIATVAKGLFRRGEYAVMAQFAGTVSLDALFAALDVATARDLIEVVPLLVWNDNVDRVIAGIPSAKLDTIIREVVADELWEQAGALITRLHAAPIRTVAQRLFERGEYSVMARLAGMVDVDVLFAALDAASARDLLEVVPLIEWNVNVEQVVADIPADRIDALLREIVDGGLWEQGNYLIEHLGPVAHERALGRIGAVSDDLFAAFHAAEVDGKLGAAAVDLLARAEASRAALPTG